VSCQTPTPTQTPTPVLDTDGDGIPNESDPDVDGDGIPNESDPDVDGDGIPNGNDTDVDGDGIPNGNDTDVDGDGIPNGNDTDVDGDGIPNGNDTDVDGDGIPNGNDTDVDGDGIPNGNDTDIDGDGISNEPDPDTDGDGVPNSIDTDDDGDGIPDISDLTPTGTPVGVNHAPSAENIVAAMTQGGTAPVVVLKGADQDGDPLTYEVLSSPAGHTLSGSGANRTYVPPLNFAGDVVFTYVAKDHRGLRSLAAQVSIRVNYVNYLNLPVCPGRVKPTSIWPVDGRMVSVGINGVSNVNILHVRQDEKPGKTSDAGPLGASTTMLRAERLPKTKKGNGRVYFIAYEGKLVGSQMGCRGEARVSVPLTRTGKAKFTLGAVRYDSTKTGAVLLP